MVPSRPVVALLLFATCAPGPESVRIDFEVSEGTNLAFDLSPDGETIVFDLLGQLWTLPIEGGEARPLTDAARDTAEDAGPTFSPDGRWIAFQSDRPGGLGLFRIPATGGEPERLTRHRDRPRLRSNPAWSPDGRSIAFAFADTLFVLDTEASPVGSARSVPIELPRRPAQVGAPTWSPDGSRIAFSTGSGGFLRVFAGSGARVWEVPVRGGVPEPLTSQGERAVAPVYSPDGSRIAFFTLDSEDGWQLWVQPYPNGAARRLTDQPAVAARRARWSPDGRELIYAAEGRLWRVAASGGSPTEIPFTARVRFERRVAELPPVRFPEPGTDRPLRGFEGLALSPDGGRIAMIALQKLWVWDVRDSARVVRDLPYGATSPSWSADGTEVAFTTGDLFAVDVGTGAVRRLTSLEGNEELPVWSPDGRYIAFVHGRRCDAFGNCEGGAIRVLDAGATEVREVFEADSIGTPGWPAPVWRPDSRAVLIYDFGRLTGNGRISHLSEPTRVLGAFPPNASFVAWTAPDSILFVRGNRLWRAGFDQASGQIMNPVAWSDDAALYPSASTTGSVLYVSGDGLRLRSPDGGVMTLGWPAVFRVPPAPPGLLIRDARIIDGRGGPPDGPRDLLIEGGRIVRIAPSGAIDGAVASAVLDADGRTVLPGFVDAHRHFWTREDGDRQMLGALYYGTTTFRDAGSTLAQIADQRDLVVSGGFPGPRLVVSGYVFHGPSGRMERNGLTDPYNQFVSERDDIGRGVAIARAFDALYVKQRGHFGWSSLVATVHEAHRHGMRVSGHCTAVLAAVAAGADGREHAAQCERDMNRVRSDVAGLEVAAGMWTAVTPAFFVSGVLDQDDPGWRSRPDIAPFLPPRVDSEETASAQTRQAVVDRYERWRASTEMLYRNGVRLAVGTDQVFPNMTQLTLRALVEAGMTPLEAITAATWNAARAIGAEDEIGSVEVGKLADLVILDADPLEDIANTERIWWVIKGGQAMDRADLLARATALSN
jgi:Tol biopolymer transport system component/imidazolonepropionase-like amidohydrolase